MSSKIILVSLNEKYREGMSAHELYCIARGYWKLTPEAALVSKIVVAVLHGKIKEIYRVQYWGLSDCKITGIDEDRYEFVGNLAEEEMRAKYIGQKVGTILQAYG